MTIDERLEALTMNLELQVREGEGYRQELIRLKNFVEIGAENIRPLARIAEVHEHRI